MPTTKTKTSSNDQNIEWLVSCDRKAGKNKPRKIHQNLIWAGSADLAMEAAKELGEAGLNLRAGPYVRPGHKRPLTFKAWADLNCQKQRKSRNSTDIPKGWTVSSMRHTNPLKPKSEHTTSIFADTADEAKAKAVELGLAEDDSTLAVTPA